LIDKGFESIDDWERLMFLDFSDSEVLYGSSVHKVASFCLSERTMEIEL
jgi:hypothetical protein